MLRRLGKDLRMANWKVSVTLEMRDWVYGTYLPPRLIRIYPDAFPHASMGLAVDLGTTSVVAYLVDFHTGRVVDSASAYNKQIACGEDVISRIIYAKRKKGLERLQKLAVETINDLLEELAAAQRHRALRDPRDRRRRQHDDDAPAPRRGPAVPARGAVHPDHVGGAQAGGAASSGSTPTCSPASTSCRRWAATWAATSPPASSRRACTPPTSSRCSSTSAPTARWCSGNKDWLLSCACSAGPAFEGGGVRHGMRASAGAIEDVFIDDATLEPTFRTIDDAPAVGICGSGLIDLLGELFLTGIVDKSGHIDRSAPTDRVRVFDGVPEYVVCWAGEGGAEKDITLTESDVTGLLRAKAAIYAGFEVLCASVGVDLADVEQIFIGGAFGQYLNVEKAIRIGLLPDQPVERFHFLGNTSALGAFAALLCVSVRHEVTDVASKMTYLELSADNTFMDEYTSALFLPHTDLSGFPSVRAALAERGRRERKRRLIHDHHDRRRRQGRDRQDDARRPAHPPAGGSPGRPDPRHRRRSREQPEHRPRPAAGEDRRRRARGDQREGARQPARGGHRQAATCSTTRSTRAWSRASTSTCWRWAGPRGPAATAPPTTCCASSSTRSPTATRGS